MITSAKHHFTVAIHSMKQWSKHDFHQKMRLLNEQTKYETDEHFLRMEKTVNTIARQISQKSKNVRLLFIDYSDGNMTMINTSALFPIRNYSKSYHAHFVFLR